MGFFCQILMIIIIFPRYHPLTNFFFLEFCLTNALLSTNIANTDAPNRHNIRYLKILIKTGALGNYTQAFKYVFIVKTAIYYVNLFLALLQIFKMHVMPLHDLKKFLIISSLGFVVQAIDKYAVKCLTINKNIELIHKKTKI